MTEYTKQLLALPEPQRGIILTAWQVLKMAEFLGDTKGQKAAYDVLERVLPPMK